MQPGVGRDLFEMYQTFKNSKAEAVAQGERELAQNRLLEIGGLAGRGDFKGASSKALSYGNFDAANDLQGIDQGRRKAARERVEHVAGVLYAADTPEKWTQALDYLEKNGETIDDEERDFNNRDVIVSQAMSLKDRLAGERADRDFKADEAYRGQQLALEREKLAKGPTNSGFTLGEGQTRYGPNGEVLAAGPPKTVQPRALTSVDKNAILEADDQVQAGNNVIDMLNRALAINDTAGSGALAGTQAFVARNDPTGFFDDKKGAATTEFNNIVLNQALSSMKSIFGGNPTEGERAVLVQLQGAADKSPVERKAIIERGIELAKRRVAFNKERAEEIRGGSYFGGASTVQPSGQQGSAEPGTVFGEAGEIPEGAIVEDDQGVRYRKVNGTLEAVQ